MIKPLQNMLSYCKKSKKNTESVNPKVLQIKNNRTILSSKCVSCGTKKSRFMKEQETSELLSSLRIKIPLRFYYWVKYV